MCNGDCTKWDYYFDGSVVNMLSTMDFVIRDNDKQQKKSISTV